MKLDRLVLVNWGQLPAGNYDMGDMTLLTGETGSGKSTMLDGLQTVMTAAYKGILNYNPGQDEVTQGQRRGKSKRSMESYIVGAEYSKFSRPEGAQGYMAAVFQPDQGEEQCKPFTAVIAASARVDGSGETRQAKLESFSMFIVEDATLDCTEFMPDADSGECIAVEQIGRRLKAKGLRVVEFHDKKMDYLCALYGRFRGKNTVPREEAFQAAKAWVQSIAYRPIGSVHELVRDEILDFDSRQLHQDIERISGLMKEVSNLRKEGQRLQESVTSLEALGQALTQTAKAHEDHVVQELFVSKLRLKLDKDQVQAFKATIKECEAKIAALQSRIATRLSRITTLDTEKTQLTARMMGIPGLLQKADYEHKIAAATRSAKLVLNDLSTSLIAASLLDQRAQSLLKRPKVIGMETANTALTAIADAYASTRLGAMAEYQPQVFLAAHARNLNAEQLLTLSIVYGLESNTGINELYQAMVGAENSLLVALTQQLTMLRPRIDEAESSARELRARKSKLSKGDVTYPRGVEFALRRIEEKFPSANTQVLCDLVEPLSEDWQPAIEGYLDGARFNLVVDQKFEAKVLDYVRAQNLSAKVIQGTLCLGRADKARLPADSIIHELRSENPIAWAYLIEQFGTVLKVTDSEALRHVSRGLTKDGKGAGGRTMFSTDGKELVFGQKAREAQLVWVTEQLSQAEDQVVTLNDSKNTLESLNGMLTGIKEPVFDASVLAVYANEISAAYSAIATLDLAESNELEIRLQEVGTEIFDLNTDNNTDRDNATLLGVDVRNASEGIKTHENRRVSLLDALEGQIRRVQDLTQVNTALSYPSISKSLETRLETGDTNLEKATSEADHLSRKPLGVLAEAREALGMFNGLCRPEEKFSDALPYAQNEGPFEVSYARAFVLLEKVQERLVVLRSIGLYNNQVELDAAAKSFNDVFTKQFCVEIKSRVDDGIRTLRQMNNELRSLKFGQDRFSIDWSRWEPELQDYLEFFGAVTTLTESSEALDLFGENELSTKHVEIRDRLIKLLLDDDQERAAKELFRIADYRNYRRYDIFNDSDSGGRIRLSEWGTGSGGQLETPAYIVRAAVVTNRLKLFEKGPSLKLLVNDESFAKMDETRARAVLGFLRDNLDMQVLSAMPTMKAGALKDEFTREYSFTRLSPVENGELDFSTECDERVFKNDKMRELWALQRTVAREKAKQLFDANEPEEVEVVDAENTQ